MRLFLIPQFTEPCVNFRLGVESGKRAGIFLEGIFGCTSRANDGSLIFDDELHPVAFSQAEAAANLERQGYLSFAADRAARRCHTLVKMRFQECCGNLPPFFIR